VSDYGYCWHPHVNTGWAPYESGYWTTDNPYGLTWVSNEPWGYAPYHYGRWANASNEWVWVPESVNTYPTYSPALVAFIPLGKSSTAWVALGPSDPYQVTYYDPSWQPVYTYPANVSVDRLVNLNVPGAVTVVPTYDFGRVIDPGIITRVDPQTIARVRPVLNPLTVDDLRTAAFQTRAARQRIDIPRQVEQRLNTPVVASTTVAPRFNQDLARAMRVERINDRVKNQKLQISDQRAAAPAQTTQPNIGAEQARERQIADLSKQAARGDRNARQQLQELRKQQADQRAAERAVPAQGQQVGQPAQPPVQPQDQKRVERQQQQAQRDAARQQMIQSQQQQRAAAQQQAQAGREQRRNQERQAQQTRNAERQQTLRSQPSRPPQAAPRPPQAESRPNRVQSAPQAQPRPPQAQPKPQNVRPPQAQPQPRQPKPSGPPAQSKPSGPPAQSKPGKKKPGGD